MNVRDYVFRGTTRSLCPHCRRVVDAKIIDSDAPDSGHRFVYEQRVDHANRGVQITVQLLFFARPREPLPPADSPPTGGTPPVDNSVRNP